MTTARTICNDAIELVGKTGLGVTPEGRLTAVALKHLNRMMQGLNARGGVTEWADLTLDGTIPLDPEMDDTLVHALGDRLITPLGVADLDPGTRQMMRDAARLLKAKFTTVEPVRLDWANGFSRFRRTM